MRKVLVVLVWWVAAIVGVSAQSITLTWDAAVDSLWTIPEYRVYSPELVGATTTGLSMVVPVTPGSAYAFSVSSFGWRLDENLNVVWAEGPKSASLLYTAPTPPPPALSATCPPDKSVLTGASPVAVTFAAPTPIGGVAPFSVSCTPESESLFYAGATQVSCRITDAAQQIASCGFGVSVTLVPPPAPSDTTPPVVSLTVTRSGKSANFSATATAKDNVGVTRVQVFLDGQGFTPCTSSPCSLTVKVAKGAHTFTAIAQDAAGNIGQATPRAVTN